jgi:hypothetical protein
MIGDFTVFSTVNLDVPGREKRQSMIPGTFGKKRIMYTACGRCGRVYCTGDHVSCPDCHGRRRAAIAGYMPGYELEETLPRKAPGW